MMGMTVVGGHPRPRKPLHCLLRNGGLGELRVSPSSSLSLRDSRWAPPPSHSSLVWVVASTRRLLTSAPTLSVRSSPPPEDDPRNPAVIADNVGDNVGDVAGMGADLFESFVGATIGAMVLALGFTAVSDAGDLGPVVLPLFIAAAGTVCSILGTFFVKTKEGGNPQHALDAGAFGAAGVMAVVTFFLANHFWPSSGTGEVSATDVGIATVIGLVGVAVGLITSYYCSMGKKPVMSIAEQCKTGTATNIIAGLGVGMQSTALPILVIAAGVVGADHFAGLYGVAIAALGMLSTTGIQLAVDAYGPIADNAGGIAEMSHQEDGVRQQPTSSTPSATPPPPSARASRLDRRR